MEAAITDPGITAGAPASSFTGSTEVRSFFETPATVAQHTVWAKIAYRLAHPVTPQAAKPTALGQLVFRSFENWTVFLGSDRQDQVGLVSQRSHNARIFDAIQSLYLSTNRPRDRQIAERITTLHRLALEEGEEIRPASLAQFTRFFLDHANLGLPKITLTPDGTLRARWIHGPEDFVAIEFTGNPLVRLVAEVPRRQEGQTASHFASEPVERVVSISRAIGASFE
jgi:hypothetical protein